MYCTSCGTRHGDDARVCTNCGKELPRIIPSVPTYLTQAILVTLCCCVPLGIPAIVFAAQVNGKLAAGDVDGALASSRRARLWCWIAFGCGLLGGLLYALLTLVGAMRQGY